MDTFRKWLCKPKADDKSLLARFYHADRALTAVASELDSFDGRAEPDRCSRLVSRLRQGQDKVLSITNQIMEELLGDDRAPRAFRAKFPEEVLQENLAGQLWFGAECLAAGSSIMNREFESAAMRPLAKAVTKSLDNVRNLLRDQCLRNNIPNSPTLRLDINDAATEQLYESLKIFDRLFAEFELRYVSAMVQVKSKHEYEMQELICVLFSETLQRALKIGLLEQDQVDSYDPALMFSIPRLAIIAGLVIYSKGPLNMDMAADQLSEMFRPFRTILIKIRDLLQTLNKNELFQLEKLLCTNEDIHLKSTSNNSNNHSSSSSSSSSCGSSNGNSTNVMTPTNPTTINQQINCDDIVKEDDIQKLSANNSNETLVSNKLIDNNNSAATTPTPIASTTAADDSGHEMHDDHISTASTCSTESSGLIPFTSTVAPSSSSSSTSSTSSSTASPSAAPATTPLSPSAASESSFDWTDDDNNKDIINQDNLATNDCASGYLIPNTNFGNLLQASETLLTDSFIASDTEYVGDNNDHSSLEQKNSSDNNNSNADSGISTENTSTPDSNHDEEKELSKNNSCHSPSAINNRHSNDNSTINNDTIQDANSVNSGFSGNMIKIPASPPLPPPRSSSTTITANRIVTRPSCSRMETTDSSEESEQQTIKTRSKNLTNNTSNETNSRHKSTSSSTSSSLTKNSQQHHNRHHHHHHHFSRHHSKKRSKHNTSRSEANNDTSSEDTSTSSSLSDGDPHEVTLALRAAGRMKFKSTENLLHRLFVCIAGVADQLQTNFASDLRQILRSVFLMNATPIDDEDDEINKIPNKSKDPSDLFEFRASEHDVIHENAGSNQSIYSAEEVNAEILDSVFTSSSAMTTNGTRTNRNNTGRSRSLGEENHYYNELTTSASQRQRSNRHHSSSTNHNKDFDNHSVGSNSPRNSSSASNSPITGGNRRNTNTAVNTNRNYNNNNNNNNNNDVRSHSNTNIITATTTTTTALSSSPRQSPPAWIPDEEAPRCMSCTIPFTAFRRRHHCRNCGGVFCGVCSNSSAPLPKYGLIKAVRVCRDCYIREVGT